LTYESFLSSFTTKFHASSGNWAYIGCDELSILMVLNTVDADRLWMKVGLH